jgi:hypothetical protein
MNLRDELLALDCLRVETFPVERFGKTLRLRELNGAGRDQITALYMRHTPYKQGQLAMVTDLPRHVNETYIALSVVDEKGARVFKDDDVTLIAERWPSELITQIANKIQQISGMTQEELESARGNSESEANFDSGSASLVTLDGP